MEGHCTVGLSRVTEMQLITQDAPAITHMMRVCHFGETKSTKNTGPERNDPAQSKMMLQMSLAGQWSTVKKKKTPRLSSRLSRETAALAKPARKSKKTRRRIFALMIATETEHSKNRLGSVVGNWELLTHFAFFRARSE